MKTKWTTMLALACMAAPAAAQDKVPAPKQKTDDANKRICRTMGETGSRLGGRRECHTQAEWNQITTENNDAIRRSMSNPR